MAQVPTLALMNGVRIPQLGFGTYKLGENAQRIVESALEVGYRHLDGAQMYLNEAEVGRAIRSSGLPRDQLFLTSKLDNPNHNPDAAKWSLDKTLSDLGTDHLDLFLIHWPLPMYYGGDLGRTWRAMEDFYEQGLARSIGVSNFESHHLELVEQTASVAPMVNQVESHPYSQIAHCTASTKVWESLPRPGLHSAEGAPQATPCWRPSARSTERAPHKSLCAGDCNVATSCSLSLLPVKAIWRTWTCFTFP